MEKRVHDFWREIATQFTCAAGTVELNHRRGVLVTEPWLISLKMLIYCNANPQSYWGIAGTLREHSYAHAQNWCQEEPESSLTTDRQNDSLHAVKSFFRS